jgi:hypothetical protein
MPQAVSRQPKAVGELPRDAVRAPLGLDGSRIVYYVPGITPLGLDGSRIVYYVPGINVPGITKRLIDRFDQDRKVFLSGDYKEEQLVEDADGRQLTADGHRRGADR